MSAIPLHLQRKFERRWAARFVSPVVSLAPKNTALKATANNLSRPAKAKEKLTELSKAGLVSTGVGGARPRLQGRGNGLRDGMRTSGLVYSRKSTMPQTNRNPNTDETGERVPARRHDSGSRANETVYGLDSTAEALRHATEHTASGAAPNDIEKTPAFDRAGLAPTI